MMRALLSMMILLALVAPASAHKLKLFATVEGDAITGYAFFIGGGRARNAPWVASTADGGEIGRGRTDAEGNFRVVPPRPATSDIVITVDTEEGHIASATVPASRLGGDAARVVTPPAAAADRREANGPGAEASAALVEEAVQRQVAPLLERIEAMDNRLRFTDVLSGVFLIVGLAGIWLWFRRRPQ